MRSYLERLAATAISPGDALHPLAGTLYARPSDAPPSSNPFEYAEPSHSRGILIPEDRTAEAPLLEREPSFPTYSETEQPESPFLTMVQPLTVPPAASPHDQALIQPPSTSRSFPEQPLHAQESVPAPFAPLISTATPRLGETPHQTPFQRPPQTAAHTNVQTNAPAETPSAIGPQTRQPVSENRTATPSSNKKTNPLDPTSPIEPRITPNPSFQETIPKPPTPSRDRAIAVPVPTAEATAARIPQPTNSAAAPSAPSLPSGLAPYQPLVSGYAIPPPPLTIQPRPQAPHPAALRERPPATREPREPDEIQIHIGRIEVSAVAPAHAPTQPTAMRKTPSLDDYLRRGNGRA